jgi:hypothetical protein
MVARELTVAEAKTQTVRAHSDLVTKLKVIEAARSEQGERFKQVEYLDELLREQITADYEKALAILKKLK